MSTELLQSRLDMLGLVTGESYVFTAYLSIKTGNNIKLVIRAYAPGLALNVSTKGHLQIPKLRGNEIVSKVQDHVYYHYMVTPEDLLTYLDSIGGIREVFRCN